MFENNYNMKDFLTFFAHANMPIVVRVSALGEKVRVYILFQAESTFVAIYICTISALVADIFSKRLGWKSIKRYNDINKTEV